MTPPQPPTKKVGMISLGCAKNLVDAEVMLGSARAHGFDVTNNPAEADVLIVNTCGFIDAAKEESIEAILEASQQRGLHRRHNQKIVVSGCLSQRFPRELSSELSGEVDAFIGLDQVAETGAILARLLEQPVTRNNGALNLVQRGSRFIPDWDTPRFRLTPPHFRYIKIAEGCNHPCSFCVIPQMRGRHRSRTIPSVVKEVRAAVESGAKEINLISQDTTYYGMDLWETKAGPRQPVDSSRGPTLSLLLDELAQIPGQFWIRLLYTHPAHWSTELIEAIARNPKVARYIDMPLQHIHPEMLQTMQRETSRQHIEDLLLELRQRLPNLAIRTTFIVGFPGETEEHFESLLQFITTQRFERLGIFTYSREEGSRAAKMPNQVPEPVKRRRHRQAMLLQQKIAREHARARIGSTLEILTDSPQQARTQHDAPDVDTRVLLLSPAPPGQFAKARIVAAQDYDLVGELAD